MKKLKGNLKNTYVKKINSLLESSQQLEKAGKKSKELTSDASELVNQRLLRNRESAKNSRERKKVYLELLEKKVTRGVASRSRSST